MTTQKIVKCPISWYGQETEWVYNHTPATQCETYLNWLFGEFQWKWKPVSINSSMLQPY